MSMQTVSLRLRSYDRNQDFQPAPVTLPPTSLPQWPTAGFKQLCRDHQHILPGITK